MSQSSNFVVVAIATGIFTFSRLRLRVTILQEFIISDNFVKKSLDYNFAIK